MPPIMSFPGLFRAREIWIDDALCRAARCRRVALRQRRVAAIVIVEPPPVRTCADKPGKPDRTSGPPPALLRPSRSPKSPRPEYASETPSGLTAQHERIETDSLAFCRPPASEKWDARGITTGEGSMSELVSFGLQYCPPYCLIYECYPDGALAAVDPISTDRP